MKRFLCICLCLLCTVGLLGGCAEQPQNNYPVTFGGATLNKAPARVVSLAPNVTDLLRALGYHEKLVGVSQFDNHPMLPQVGSSAVPDIDGIIALSPDLVLTPQALSAEDAERLAIRSIAVAVVPYCTTLAQLKTLYGDLAALMNGQLQGRPQGESAAEKLQKTVDGCKSSENKAVLYLADESNQIAATEDTLIGDLLTKLGCTNAAKGLKNWAQIDPKTVSADLIFCKKGQKDAVSSLYAHTAAAKNGQVYEIDPALLERQGSCLFSGIKALSEPLPKKEK